MRAAGVRGMWSGLNAVSLVSMAHRIRAFLLARATTVFCHPKRSFTCGCHRLMRSDRLLALMTPRAGCDHRRDSEQTDARHGQQQGASEFGFAGVVEPWNAKTLLAG